MRLILFFVLISLASQVHSADGETSKKKIITHHLQFLIGNYISESATSPNITGPFYILNTPPGQFNIINGNGEFYGNASKPVFTPLYSYSIGFDYKVEFSNRLGLRTGFNYYTYGFRQTGHIAPEDASYPTIYCKQMLFISSLLVPVHLMTFFPLSKGRLVFSIGPDFYFPINSFGNFSWVQYPPTNNDAIHYHSTPAEFYKGGSLGFTLGFGYETKFVKGTTIEFTPDFRLLNAVPFDFEGQGTHIYQNYVFNMSLGLSTYITFY